MLGLGLELGMTGKPGRLAPTASLLRFFHKLLAGVSEASRARTFKDPADVWDACRDDLDQAWAAGIVTIRRGPVEAPSQRPWRENPHVILYDSFFSPYTKA